MTDEEFELHRAALQEEGIVVEAKISGRADRANGEVAIGLIVQSDDFSKVGPANIKVGWDYQIVFFEKGIHPPKPKRPQQRRTAVVSDSTVGTAPAPGGDSSVRAISQEVEDAEWAHAKKMANKYLGICQALRNDAQFRGFMFDYYKTPILRNPIESIEWVRQKQHELLGVDSCARVYPGTHAEEMVKWMQSAFACEKLNLPIPATPLAPKQDK